MKLTDVRQSSVRLSVPSFDSCTPLLRVGCCRVSMACCTAGGQQQPRRSAGSATLSADVGSWAQTCAVRISRKLLNLNCGDRCFALHQVERIDECRIFTPDVAGSNRQKEEKSKCAEKNESSSDYEEVEQDRSASKAGTLPNRLQPSCVKPGQLRAMLRMCILIAWQIII